MCKTRARTRNCDRSCFCKFDFPKIWIWFATLHKQLFLFFLFFLTTNVSYCGLKFDYATPNCQTAWLVWDAVARSSSTMLRLTCARTAGNKRSTSRLITFGDTWLTDDSFDSRLLGAVCKQQNMFIKINKENHANLPDDSALLHVSLSQQNLTSGSKEPLHPSSLQLFRFVIFFFLHFFLYIIFKA